MSDKQNLQKALDAQTKAKQEDKKALNIIAENNRQLRREAEEKSSRQS
ncbi:unnamed protein product [marine sediment metagenome]|uniref:Uncharacterized protein n=1 Tax=marine sediment metagenome TaxID=412755 RepID=X1KZZ0_9ZZZZ